MQTSKGKLYVISGPSGVGKGTVVKALLEQMPDLMMSVSVTTRQPREGEIHGKHYFFTDRAHFLKMREENKFLESAEHYGILYGTPKEFVEKMLREGKNVLLEIDTEGAFQVKAKMPECVLIFLSFPSMEVLHDRLAKRGTETEEVQQIRLAKAVKEYEQRTRFDYIVANDILSETIEKVAAIFRLK